MSMRITARLRYLVFAALVVFSLLAIGLYAMIASRDCTGELVSAKACYYLKSPLVWIYPSHGIDSPPPTIINPTGVPTNVNGDSVRGIVADDSDFSSDIIGAYPGGFIGVAGTWSEQSEVGNSLFVTPSGKPFLGAFELGIFNFPEPVSLIIACLIDFNQVPCSPGAPAVQRATLLSDQYLSTPIEIVDLNDGLHDLLVVAWQDFGESTPPNDPARIVAYQKAVRYTIAAGGTTETNPVEFHDLPLPFHVFGLEGLAVTDSKDPWDSYGGLPPFTYIASEPGKDLDLYLHLFNQQAFTVDYAIAAFIDHRQIPIKYDGVVQPRLYFKTKANSWYPIPITIPAPQTPGQYELVILGEHFPQARMDLETTHYSEARTLSLDVWSSNRIVLEVQEAD